MTFNHLLLLNYKYPNINLDTLYLPLSIIIIFDKIENRDNCAAAHRFVWERKSIISPTSFTPTNPYTLKRAMAVLM